MNAFRAYDYIEDRRWADQQLTEEKDKWIDDRANKLIAMFPTDPLAMRSLFISKEACLALIGSEAQEIYNDYISRLCYARAEEEWQRRAPCPF
jgi:hypothetical protein